MLGFFFFALIAISLQTVTEKDLTVGNIERKYLLIEPSSPTGTIDDVIFLFHDEGKNASDLIDAENGWGFQKVSDDNNVFVVVVESSNVELNSIKIYDVSIVENYDGESTKRWDVAHALNSIFDQKLSSSFWYFVLGLNDYANKDKCVSTDIDFVKAIKADLEDETSGYDLATKPNYFAVGEGHGSYFLYFLQECDTTIFDKVSMTNVFYMHYDVGTVLSILRQTGVDWLWAILGFIVPSSFALIHPSFPNQPLDALIIQDANDFEHAQFLADYSEKRFIDGKTNLNITCFQCPETNSNCTSYQPTLSGEIYDWFKDNSPSFIGMTTYSGNASEISVEPYNGADYLVMMSDVVLYSGIGVLAGILGIIIVICVCCICCCCCCICCCCRLCKKGKDDDSDSDVELKEEKDSDSSDNDSDNDAPPPPSMDDSDDDDGDAPPPPPSDDFDDKASWRNI